MLNKLLSSFIFLIFSISLGAHAEITISVVSGASNFLNGEVIMGGTAGPDCSSTATSDFTCNSCFKDAPLGECNFERIYSDLTLRIFFKSDSVAGTAYLRANNGIDIPLENVPTELPTGSTHMLLVEWADLCNSLNSTSCESVNFRELIRIGVSSNNDGNLDEKSLIVQVADPDVTDSGLFDTIESCESKSVEAGGICGFELTPLEGAVRINNVQSTQGFPYQGRTKVTQLLFLTSSLGFPNSLQNSRIFAREVENNELKNPIISNLDRFKQIFVRVATMDEAGNISRFTSDQSIIDNCATLTPISSCSFSTTVK